VANLQLVFQQATPFLDAFAKSTTGIDKAQDAANSRLREAREAFAVALTPAITSATEASARYIESIADFVSDGGAFRKFIAVITAGASESAVAGFKAVFGDAEEAVKSAVEEVKKAPDALQGTIDAFEVIGTKTLSIGELRDKLKGLKEDREKLLETDKAGLDANAKEIASLEARIKAIDGSTKSIQKKTDAVKKLTEAQLAQIDAENAIRGDASANIFAVTPTEPTEVGQAEEQIEEVTFQYAELNRLRTEFQGQQLEGIFDYNTQRALIEQEYLQGNLKEYTDYQSALSDLDNARLQQQFQILSAASSIFGSLGGSSLALKDRSSSSGATASSSETTGITVANSTEGSSGTNANLPPYYALAFIMKS
jgi:hypothetical protein